MITPIENAADLAENKQEISYGTLHGGSTMTFFRVSAETFIITFPFIFLSLIPLATHDSFTYFVLYSTFMYSYARIFFIPIAAALAYI